MTNIFDKYGAYELRKIFKQKNWPKDFKESMHDIIAYELLYSWLENVDEKTYKERFRDIIENLTYGYPDQDGKEMLEFTEDE